MFLKNATETPGNPGCFAPELPSVDYFHFNTYFFFARADGEKRSTSVLSLSALDQLDRSPLYCRTPNRLLIEKIKLLLYDIRSAISCTDMSVDERR